MLPVIHPTPIYIDLLHANKKQNSLCLLYVPFPGPLPSSQLNFIRTIPIYCMKNSAPNLYALCQIIVCRSIVSPVVNDQIRSSWFFFFLLFSFPPILFFFYYYYSMLLFGCRYTYVFREVGKVFRICCPRTMEVPEHRKWKYLWKSFGESKLKWNFIVAGIFCIVPWTVFFFFNRNWYVLYSVKEAISEVVMLRGGRIEHFFNK